MPVVTLRLPRGIRNNNPGNLRLTDAIWLGERASGDDPEFEIFDSAVYGIRALAKLLRRYHRAYRLKSVGAIISRYAPIGENDTLAYIDDVAAALRVAADAPLDLDDPATLRRLVRAIIRHENGRRPDGTDWYSAAEIDEGVRLAME